MSTTTTGRIDIPDPTPRVGPLRDGFGRPYGTTPEEIAERRARLAAAFAALDDAPPDPPGADDPAEPEPIRFREFP